MAVQTSATVSNLPFILRGNAYQVHDATLKTIDARSTDVAYGTVLAYDNATSKWVHYTDVNGLTGMNIPCGILMETVAAADIAAGDVASVKVLVGDAMVDKNQIVLENSLTLASVVSVAKVGDVTSTGKLDCYLTIEQILRMFGIFCGDTITTTGTEN